MTGVKNQEYFAIFKYSGKYIIGNYSGDNLSILEKDKRNFEMEYEGKINNLSQLHKVFLLLKETNETNSELSIQDLEAILENCD